MSQKFPLLLIRLYQKTSKIQDPIARALFHTERVCRFDPTCSEYMYQAIKKHGTKKGVFLGLKRIGRCGPWTKGGYDPVK